MKNSQFSILAFLCVAIGVWSTAAGLSTRVLPGVAVQQAPLKLPLKDPRIVIRKSERRLELYAGGAVVRRYKIGLGLSPVEDKVRQGDRRTPEGEFYVFTRNDKSAFYLSLGLSYPNIEDAERGLRDKLISQRQHDVIVRANKRKATPPQKHGPWRRHLHPRERRKQRLDMGLRCVGKCPHEGIVRRSDGRHTGHY